MAAAGADLGAWSTPRSKGEAFRSLLHEFRLLSSSSMLSTFTHTLLTSE